MCDRCLRSGDTEALGQTLEGCGGVSRLCSSKEELRPSSRTGCLLQTLPSGPAACPFPGQGGDEAQPRGPGPRGSWPTAGQGPCVLGGAGGAPCCSCSSGRGRGSNLTSQQRLLNPGGSAPEGAQPPRAAQSCFLLLFICPRNLSK